MTDEFVLYPTPTENELEAPPLFWIGYNPFQWSILQGKIEEIDNPELWENYTEEIQDKISEMFVPMNPPDYYFATKVYRTTNLVTTTGQVHIVSWEAEAFDTMAGFDSGSPARITVPQDGFYNIRANCSFAVNTVNRRSIRLHDDTAALLGWASVSPAASSATDFSVEADVFLSAGQWVELRVTQNSGGNLDLVAGIASCSLIVKLEGTEPPVQ